MRKRSSIFGTGMCFALGQFGSGIGNMIIGIIIGIIGVIICILNLSIHKKLLEKGKEKYSYEIIELAKQITGETL